MTEEIRASFILTTQVVNSVFSVSKKTDDGKPLFPKDPNENFDKKEIFQPMTVNPM